MSDGSVVVDIVANPRQFVDGFREAEASAATAVSGIDASLQKLVETTSSVAAQMNSGTSSMTASARDFMAATKQVDAALETQAKTLGDVATKQKIYDNALKSGILTQEEHAKAIGTLAKEAAKIKPIADAAATGTKNADAAVKGLGDSSVITGRQLGVLAGQLVRGDFNAFQQSALTATTQSGLLNSALTGLGITILAVAGFLIGAVVTYADSERELSAFNKAIILTGDYARLSAEDLSHQVGIIGEATGSYGGAKDALLALANTGKFAGTNLENAAQGVVAFANLTEQEVGAAAKEFEKLAADPYNALVKLNEAYHFLTASQAEEVRMLEEIGDKTGAAQYATDLFASSMIDRDQEYRESLSGITLLWEKLKTTISGAYQSSKEFFQETSKDAKSFFDQMKDWLAHPIDTARASFAGAVSGTMGARDPAQVAEEQAAATRDAARAQQELDDFLIATNASIDKQTSALVKSAETYGKGKVGLVEYQIQQQLTAAAAQFTGDALDVARNEILQHGDAALKAAKKIDDLTASHRQAKVDARDLKSTLSDLNQQINAGVRVAGSLSSEYGGPLAAATSKYQQEITRLGDALDALHEKAAIDKTFAISPEYQQQWRELAEAMSRVTQAYDLATARAAALSAVVETQGSSVDQLIAKYDEENLALTRSEYEREHATAIRRAEHEAVQATIKAIKESTDASGVEQAALAAGLPVLLDTARAHVSIGEAARESEQIMKQWASIASSGFDSVADAVGNLVASGLKDWKSFGNSLVQTAKQFISSVISEFLKLAVFNGIINSLFGTNLATFGGGGGSGGLGWVGTIGSLVGSGTNTDAGGAAGGSAGGGGGSGGFMGNASSALSLGRSIWNGFSSGFSAYTTPGATAGSTWLGSYSGAQGTMAPWSTGASPWATGSSPGVAAGSYSYTPSTLGYAAAGAAGVYAGYSRWEGSNKDLGGGLGAAAYGVGTYYAAIGVSAALSGGVAAGLAAIPVIGWIALAAMIVDMASGGKLFGTSPTKFKDAATKLSVGPDGASFENSLVLKGQKAFFGGAYTRESNPRTTFEQRQAANAFYDAILEQSTDFAKQFGQTVGLVASGSFTQHYDKKGNPTGKTESVIDGKTYKDETADQFGSRIIAESFILDLKAAGVNVRTYTNEFINDADKYANAVQDVAAALGQARSDLAIGLDITGGTSKVPTTLQDIFDSLRKFNIDGDTMSNTYARLANEQANLNNGMTLLTGQDNVTAVEAFVASIRRFGESMTEAYQRVAQASQKYYETIGGVNQQLGGYKQQLQTGSSVGEFANSMAGISQTMTQTIATLNQAAIAAGLQGAKEEDLARVHQLAAIQAAQAMAQLVSAGRNLANQLYGTNPSLEELQSQIAALEGRANVGATSVDGFGDAMTRAANAAKAAMDLLLGDLSPLNDQQKLQKALQGQREGLVTPEQVLAIGRRLFATTQAYNDLFDQVNAIGDLTGQVGVGAGTGSGGGLSNEEQTRLSELIKQRDEMQDQQRAAQARELASIVANLALVQGASYEDIADQLNFALEDLAADLGFSQEELIKFLDGLKANDTAVPDALNSNFDRLIEFLAAVFDVPVPTNPNDTTKPAIGGGADTTKPGVNPTAPSKPMELRDDAAREAISNLQGSVEDTAATSQDILVQIRDALREIAGNVAQSGADSPRNLRGLLR